MSDVWDQLERFRKVKTLASGSRLLLRPLTLEDKQGLVDLFARASSEDLEYFREDARDPAVVERWVDTLNLQQVFPLIAVVDDQIIGDATLHFRERHHRHLAWIRIFLDRSYRRKGIGTLMLQGLVDIARRAGLQQVYSEIVVNQPRVIKAFQALGFRSVVTLEDYFITRDDKLLDMTVLALRLIDASGDF